MASFRDKVAGSDVAELQRKAALVRREEQRNNKVLQREASLVRSLHEFFEVASEKGHAPFTLWRCHKSNRWPIGAAVDLEPVATGYPLTYVDIDSRGGWWSSIRWPLFVTRAGAGYSAAPMHWSNINPPRITTRLPDGGRKRQRPPVSAIILECEHGRQWMADDIFDPEQSNSLNDLLLNALNRLNELENEAAAKSTKGMLAAS